MKLSEMEVFKTVSMTYFDFGAIIDVISSLMCGKFQLIPRQTNRQITMVENKEALVVGEVSGVPITIGSTTTEISFLVICSSPYQLIIGCPFMKVLRASLDFDKDITSIVTMMSSHLYHY